MMVGQSANVSFLVNVIEKIVAFRLATYIYLDINNLLRTFNLLLVRETPQLVRILSYTYGPICILQVNLSALGNLFSAQRLITAFFLVGYSISFGLSRRPS